MQARAIEQITDTGSAGELLGFARTRKADAEAAEADVLAAAAAWAEMHPPESIHDAATWPGTTGFGGEVGLLLAGEGAPLVAEFCVAELAAALKLSTDAGRTLIAHGLELKYRLTRTNTPGARPGRWHRGGPARSPNRPSASVHGRGAFVDTQVAPFAHRVSWAQLERLIAEAKARFMPAAALSDAAVRGRAAPPEHPRPAGLLRRAPWRSPASSTSLMPSTSTTRWPEAPPPSRPAAARSPLDVRRSMAAGDIARRQLALDLSQADPVAGGFETLAGARSSTTGQDRPKPRQVVLYVHLSEAAIRGTGEGIDLARVENRRQGVTADQVRVWCANPDTHVVVKPVIDLAEHISVNSYEVPDRLAEQAAPERRHLRLPLVHPPRRRCDCDHVIPHSRGGSTCSCNTATLCRRHHRLKTHTAWTYTALEPGSYLWSSPHGYQFLRDHTGTVDVTRDVLSRRSPALAPQPPE